MRIFKAVITAAGEAQRRIPLQTLVDTDGVTRTVLAMLVNETLGAGIEEISVVVAPGDEPEYARAVPEHTGRLQFFPQNGPRGYAQALWSARDFVKGEPFLHLVSDHVYVGRCGDKCAASIVRIASEANCSVSGVQATHESLISRFGVIGGFPLPEPASTYQVETVREKPTPTEAEESLIVAGLRAGYYLAFFGMHVFTPTVLDLIGQQIASGTNKVSVSAALHSTAQQERYLACRVAGDRYDLGPRYGLLTAQLALTLAGKDREEILSTLVTLLASNRSNGAGA